MRKLLAYLKHRIAMWLWRDNDWTKFVNDLEHQRANICCGKIDEYTCDFNCTFDGLGPVRIVMRKAD